jgi:hypothetical protein
VLPNDEHVKYGICCDAFFGNFFQIFPILGNRTPYMTFATSALTTANKKTKADKQQPA